MGQDWNEPLDKGPPIEERERWRSKKTGRKRFVLESRYVGPLALFAHLRDWHRYRGYFTEKARERALAQLQRRDSRWEYRIPPDEAG